MRVLLTGGGGFLGAAIIKRFLGQDIEVRVFDTNENRDLGYRVVGNAIRKVEWCLGNVSDATDVLAAAQDCDAIVHLAGVLTPFCQKDPLAGAMINVIGTLNIFEAAKHYGIRKVIYTSSGGVFGLKDAKNPFPLTHYGAFKLANEGSARAYWADDRIASVGFRPFVVYGPGRETGLSAGPTLACRAVALNQPYTIPLSGTMGLVYVDDVAAAFEVAVLTNFDGAHTFNLSGTPVDVSTIVTTIHEIAPDAQISNMGDSLPSIATVTDEYKNDLLLCPPATTLKNGLRKTIDFYRGH